MVELLGKITNTTIICHLRINETIGLNFENVGPSIQMEIMKFKPMIRQLLTSPI